MGVGRQIRQCVFEGASDSSDPIGGKGLEQIVQGGSGRLGGTLAGNLDRMDGWVR